MLLCVGTPVRYAPSKSGTTRGGRWCQDKVLAGYPFYAAMAGSRNRRSERRRPAAPSDNQGREEHGHDREGDDAGHDQPRRPVVHVSLLLCLSVDDASTRGPLVDVDEDEMQCTAATWTVDVCIYIAVEADKTIEPELGIVAWNLYIYLCVSMEKIMEERIAGSQPCRK